MSLKRNWRNGKKKPKNLNMEYSNIIIVSKEVLEQITKDWSYRWCPFRNKTYRTIFGKKHFLAGILTQNIGGTNLSEPTTIEFAVYVKEA